MENTSSLIRANKSNNRPILELDNTIVPNTYFRIVKLNQGESHDYQLDQHESIAVIMQGNCDVVVDETIYENVGKRKDIWSGRADSIYVGTGSYARFTANCGDTEIAIAAGICTTSYDSFRIWPSEVQAVDVGSNESKCHRTIYHILGQNGRGRAGNLLVSELYCDAGSWSGYPPHKHDEENMPYESDFEETYHYRFNPENGFGGQFCYVDGHEPEAYMTRSGDTFAFRKGYHPTVTSPGHEEYILTILVGKHQRSLVQNFEEQYRYMIENIPGITDMTDKFK